MRKTRKGELCVLIRVSFKVEKMVKFLCTDNEFIRIQLNVQDLLLTVVFESFKGKRLPLVIIDIKE